MLHQWLAPMSVAAFVQTHLQKQPYAQPGSALRAVSLFQWQVLERILAVEPPPDVLVIARGKVVDIVPPRTVAATRALMQAGSGLVIRRAERHDPGLAALALAFAKDLPGEVHLQLFVTPAGSYSFGWHYDAEDVFIVQTHGVKEYFFRANTVARAVQQDSQPDFAQFRHEVSPLAAARLLPGDWLYIPARWWHVAKCVEESLSISVGVCPQMSW